MTVTTDDFISSPNQVDLVVFELYFELLRKDELLLHILLPTIYDYILKTTQHKHINSTRCHLNANIKSYE